MKEQVFVPKTPNIFAIMTGPPSTIVYWSDKTEKQKSKKANKPNSSVRFLGESMARQSAFEIN